MKLIIQLSNDIINVSNYTQDVHQSIIRIWSNKEFKRFFFKTKNHNYIPDGFVYLINKITSIPQLSSYRMDNSDILYSNQSSFGLSNIMEFQYEGVKLKLFDFGGQRNERKVFIKIKKVLGFQK
jgi:hypothetical protein